MHSTLPIHPSLLHPLTGLPLRAVGLRPDGSPLWPIMGGDGTGADVNDATKDAADQGADADAAADQGSGQAGDGADDKANDAGDKDALGDPGKQALDRMKTDRNTARREAAEAKAERDALQARLDGKEKEHEAEQAAQKVRDEALAAANERILKAELRVVAKGKLTDPNDVFRFPEYVDLSALEVGADGEVDTGALEAAVTNLITKRPDLAVQDGKRFQGGADAGARNDTQVPLEQQIAEATKAGDFQTAIALKQQRAAELKGNA